MSCCADRSSSSATTRADQPALLGLVRARTDTTRDLIAERVVVRGEWRRARPRPDPAAVVSLVAGVDSSTQSCKVVVCDAETGAVLREGRAAHPPGTEVDPEAWWEALQTAVAGAGGLDDVEALSVGGQQHGMVCLDAEGAVIRPALLWNDTRSAPAAATWSTSSGPPAGPRPTGLGAGRLLHRDQAAVAGRPRTRERGPGRGGGPAARLVDLAAARHRSVARPDDGPVRRVGHGLLVGRHR